MRFVVGSVKVGVGGGVGPQSVGPVREFFRIRVFRAGVVVSRSGRVSWSPVGVAAAVRPQSVGSVFELACVSWWGQ